MSGRTSIRAIAFDLTGIERGVWSGAAIDRYVRELDRLAEDLEELDREIAKGALDDPAVKHKREFRRT